MTSHRKTSVPTKKRHPKGQQASGPEKAEEYLEAGVELEEAGEKWRAGDAQKALRFFTKALDLYDAGLRVHADSFDLAYNKARLQYDISQQPKLVSALSQSLVDLLGVAAESHVVASRLVGGHNADVIFNLAQVYTSLAEAKLDEPDVGAVQKRDICVILHQALDLFDQCLKMQEQELQDAQRLETQPIPASSPDTSLETPVEPDSDPEGTMEEVWASVAEPVTEDTLIDTCLAKLDALKILCNVQPSGSANDLRAIEEIFVTGLNGKLDILGQKVHRSRDIALGRIAFLVAFAIARFRIHHADIQSLEHDSHQALQETQPFFPKKDDAEALCIIAENHTDINAAIEEGLSRNGSTAEVLSISNRIRWQHITKALEHYGLASQIPGVHKLAQIHLLRGDSELLRARLGDEPSYYDLAIQNRPTLLKNAAVYYDAARKAMTNQNHFSDANDDRLEVEIKLRVVTDLLDNQPIESQSSLMQSPSGIQVLSDMRDHGLLHTAALSMIERKLGVQV